MQLQKLWQLQEIDLEIKALMKTIETAPGESGIDAAQEELALLNERFAALDHELRENKKKLKDLELQTQKIVDDRKTLSENMYSGKGTTAKELEQMLHKMDFLADEKKKLEDNIILVMEETEDQEAELGKLKSEINSNEQELSSKKDKLVGELAEYEKRLNILKEKKDAQLILIDKSLTERYEMLAKKHNGKALAMVENDICGACRVSISSALRGKLYNPEALVYCENCGRLLLMAENPR